MINQESEHLCPIGLDLASRASAKSLRLNVEQVVSTRKLAIIDLTNVVSISESYADELFAVLIEQHGLDWFSKNIKILFATTQQDAVLRSIATAIRRRLENQALDIKTTVDNLIAAKKSASSSTSLCH